MLLPSRQPGGDRVRGGLLGHAVVADHRVEAAPGVGVLGGVVRLQRGRDAPLVLREGGRTSMNVAESQACVEGDSNPQLGQYRARIEPLSCNKCIALMSFFDNAQAGNVWKIEWSSNAASVRAYIWT